MSKKYKDFSFSPDIIEYDSEGYPSINKDLTDYYIRFSSVSNGVLYYTPKSNRYWSNPGVEMSPERLESVLPYLRWKYDDFSDETVEKSIEVSDEDGKERTITQAISTGRKINKFPPTPENIAKKRTELASNLFDDSAEALDKDAIITLTTPHTLEETERFKAKLRQDTTAEDRWARRINKIL